MPAVIWDSGVKATAPLVPIVHPLPSLSFSLSLSLALCVRTALSSAAVVVDFIYALLVGAAARDERERNLGKQGNRRKSTRRSMHTAALYAAAAAYLLGYSRV